MPHTGQLVSTSSIDAFLGQQEERLQFQLLERQCPSFDSYLASFSQLKLMKQIRLDFKDWIKTLTDED